MDCSRFKIDAYEGGLADAMIGLECSPVGHCAFGEACHLLRFDLEMEDDDFATIDFQGELELDHGGFMLYGISYF